MSALEAENMLLTMQIKKVGDIKLNLEKPELMDKVLQFNFKKITQSLKQITEQFNKNATELNEFRKKERIFNLHKRCAEDTTKKLQTNGKKLTTQQQELADKTMQVNLMQTQIMNMQVDIKNLHTVIGAMDEQKQQNLQEIQLLKDYVYGLDAKAKEIHAHRFLKRAGSKENRSRNEMSPIRSDFGIDSRTSLKPSNFQSCGASAILNSTKPDSVSPVFASNKSLSSKFQDIINKIQRTGVSFRETIDPKVLVANFKSELEMTEDELKRAQEVE